MLLYLARYLKKVYKGKAFRLVGCYAVKKNDTFEKENNTGFFDKENYTEIISWSDASVKTKGAVLVALFVSFVLILISVCFYMLNKVQTGAADRVAQYYGYNNVLDEFIKADDMLKQYLKTMDQSGGILDEHYIKLATVRTNVSEMENDIAVVGETRNALIRALKNGLDEYCDIRNNVVSLAKNGKEAEAVDLYYESAEPVSQYIVEYSRDILSASLDEGQLYFLQQSKKNESQYRVATIICMIILMIISTVIVRFSVDVLSSVAKLHEASKKITQGNYNIPDIQMKNHDEFYELSQAFNEMRRSVSDSFDAINENARITEKLHEKEMEAAETMKLMQEVKMAQLRSQIKPHFLFNSLNIISRMARIEKAPKTEQLILSLSRLFRYNLKTDDNEVTLQREINIVDDYIKIQQTRFGSRIGMQWRIAQDVDTERELVPSFIFQPIVENAIVHGIEPKIEGGVIRIRIQKDENNLIIIISDNGVGMDKETARRVLDNDGEKNNAAESSHNGIGVKNVAERIKMLRKNSTVTVHSKEGLGTSFFIKMPLERQ